MTTNTIKVSIKSVYGNILIYPECEQSKLFCQLTGNKTLLQKDLNVIKKLGYQIDQVIPETLKIG